MTILSKKAYLESAKIRLVKRTRQYDECWVFVGANVREYGSFYFSGKQWRAHRASYTIFVGTIPKGLTIDHKCRNRSCVNPKHLRPMTQRQNVLIGEGLCAINARKKFCPKGHPLKGKNLDPYNLKRGWRYCLTCIRTRVRATQ